LANGIDHADLIVARAPKPILIVSTTRDFFSIQGARETFTEVKKTYRDYGKAGNITMSEADYHHGHIRKNNEAIYEFFQKELKNQGNPAEESVEIFPENELNVTPTGQLSTSFKTKTVFDLNNVEVEELVSKLGQSRKNNPEHLEFVLIKAKELSGNKTPEAGKGLVFRGRYRRDGYSVEMYALEGDPGYVIPLLLAIPDGGGIYPAVIYIHPEGKEEGIGPEGNIEKLVQNGYMVAAPDLLGIGETQSQRQVPGSHGYEAQLVGRSIVGIQAGDIMRVVNFLKALPNTKAENIQAIAFGEQCPALLHAAAFEQAIRGISLIEAPISYSTIAQTRLYKYSLSFSWGVAGALKAYDLPDLAACVAPRKLLFIGLLDGEKEPASKALMMDQMDYLKLVYEEKSTGNLKIIPFPNDGIINSLITWLKI
jgi:hypothetical protein